MNKVILALVATLVLAACEQKKATTYKAYSSLFVDDHTPEVAALLSKWDSIKKPSPEYIMRIDSGWFFVKGDSLEGLTTQIATNINQPVTLPHRIDAANHPMWYRTSVTLDRAGIFYIVGDDGVQLFINGNQVKRLRENFFAADFTGTADVTVRVLNNAMAGGLRYFMHLSSEQYEKFNHDKANYLRTKHLVESAALIPTLTNEQLSAVNVVVDNWSEVNLSKAEKLFEDYPFITGPWLVKDGDSLKIMAMVDQENEVTLQYGSDSTNMNQKVSSSGKILNFALPADSSRIFYQLLCKNTVSQIYTISNKENSKFTFNAWADSQGGWEKFAQNLSNVSRYDDAFGIGAGDLVNNGSNTEEWREFYNILSSSAAERPYYLVSGNHDYDGYYDDLKPKLYRSMNRLAKPHYYSWTYANCMFIALDPNESFPIQISEDGEQYKWFMNEINSDKWRNAKWRFVFLHQPPYSQGWEGYTGDHFLRKLLEPITEKNSIDFVISGHTHDYERLSKKYENNETTYLILGGGGGSLETLESSMNPKMDTVIKRHHIGHFSVSGDTVRFEAIDVEGKVMDGYTRVKNK